MAVPCTLLAVADQPYTVRLHYATQVQVSDDGTEQRRARRQVPLREEQFTVRAAAAPGMAQQGHGILDALLHAGQAQPILVPYWPHGALLGEAAAAGSNVVLSVDTTDRDFTVGGSALLWRDEATYEVVTVTAKTGSSLTADLVGSWPAGTFVLPLRPARLSNDADVRRLGARANETPLAFTFEAGADPGVTVSTPAIFTVAAYRKVDPSDAYVRQVDRLENATYTFADYPRRLTAGGHRTIHLWLPTRASVHALEQWFHGQRGSLVPFWLPTYQQDFEVVSAVGSALTVKWLGYTDRMFLSEGRRYLAFVQPNGTVTERYVTASVDNGNGTETLTLDASVPTGYTLLSYLLYIRIADDTLEYTWRNNSFAECAINVVELAAELVPV